MRTRQLVTHVIWGLMDTSLVHVLRASPARIRMHAVCQNASYARLIRIHQNQGAALAPIVPNAQAGPQPMVLRATPMSQVVFVSTTSFWIRPQANANPARLPNRNAKKLGLRWLL